MLVLGTKHKFSSIEQKQLQDKSFNLTIIPYRNRAIEDVLAAIEAHRVISSITILVLNTTKKIDDAIINYLTNTQLTKNGHILQIITIEECLERFLHKCYVPEDNHDLHFLMEISAYNSLEFIQKRCVDYFGIFLLFFFSWPVLLLCMYKIHSESKGPKFFRQDRVGFRKKEFSCTKFRSMTLDAEKNGAQFASENDPRVFAWGEFMRKTRFDELPQMLNILKGEMHLIGPRPERKCWIDVFEKQIPFYHERHIVAPGITGWAQVMYPYGANAEDARQKLMYDLYYIKHWSLKLELKIVWLTALTVIGRKGL